MLPIHEALPDLKAALEANAAAVLVAPPGAGKTTVVPLELLDAPWRGDGKIIVLEPRRLAARAAARRMAGTLGEAVGRTVGYRVRLESKVSDATRIEVVTEGVFTRMILDDPGLEGVAAVLFDEFHERSLDADLGLALARDAQGVLRPDLRLLIMSATLDGARIAAHLSGAPVIECSGRIYPIETRYLGRNPAVRIEDQTVRAIKAALAEQTGSVLVFLPGQGEIRRTEERLREALNSPAVDICPLYGAMEAADQDRAIAPSPPGRRKVVLATSIAETSLTIEGVRVVIDCGLSRVPRFDPASGLTRLETVRVTGASADQRRGRAGRTEPGVCYRLWDEAETRALVAHGRPEILETDLSRLALDLARWGAKDAGDLTFLDPPPAAAMAEARALLERLEALDGAGALTEHGRRIAQMPLPPRLAHMVALGGPRAGLIAAVLSERGLGGNDADLRHRIERLERDRSKRAADARALAARWAKGIAPGDYSDGALLALAFPERVAKARGKPGEFQLVTGRGVWIEPADALAREPWLAVGDLGGAERRDRILTAAPIDEDEVLRLFGAHIEAEDRLSTDARGKLRASRVRRLGRLVIDEKPIDVSSKVIKSALLAEVRDQSLVRIPFGEGSNRLRARLAFIGEPLADTALIERLDEWLAPQLDGLKSLGALSDARLEKAMLGLVPWEIQRRLDDEAPARFTAPTGNSFAIDYAAEGGPRVEVRVGEVYGLTTHPTVGRAVPLTLSLLSPAQRPIQTTKDLPGFWAGSWADVRKDMRARYPKHVWPEDPANAAPTTRAKPRK
jgi:ATP-dependent helicase HrpB